MAVHGCSGAERKGGAAERLPLVAGKHRSPSPEDAMA